MIKLDIYTKAALSFSVSDNSMDRTFVYVLHYLEYGKIRNSKGPWE